MRKVMFGVGFPLIMFVLIVMVRGTWKTDIHPYQLAWLLWVSSILIDGIALGMGLRAYWVEGGHRRDGRPVRNQRR